MLLIAQKAEKWMHTLSRILSYLSSIVLLLMTFLMTIDVFGRYFFNSPIAGSPDIIQMMMVILVYSSFAYCASVNGNVRVEVLYSRFPKLIQAYLDVVTSLLSVLMIGLIAWRLGARAWEIYLNPPGPITSYFQWSLMPFIAFAAVGALFLCLEFLIWFFHSLSHIRSS